MNTTDTPEFQISMLEAYIGAMEDGRPPSQIEQMRQEMEDIMRRAAIEQDRYETLAMQWSGVGFRASEILRRRVPAFLEAAQLHQPITLQELIPRITNEHQRDTLNRLRYGSEARQIFLSEFKTHGSGSHARELEGEFTVLGTRNRRGERESYTVKWYKQGLGRGSFWCNCPDHKFNSSKKHIVCKHICFLVCKVARILDVGFFDTHRLTVEQHAHFLRIVSENTLFSDQSLVRQRQIVETPGHHAAIHTMTQEQKRAPFFECRKPIEPEDSCPICYDDLASSSCLNCPTCSNNVHRECMEVWLEGHNTCVYCRSSVWNTWK